MQENTFIILKFNILISNLSTTSFVFYGVLATFSYISVIFVILSDEIEPRQLSLHLGERKSKPPTSLA